MRPRSIDPSGAYPRLVAPFQGGTGMEAHGGAGRIPLLDGAAEMVLAATGCTAWRRGKFNPQISKNGFLVVAKEHQCGGTRLSLQLLTVFGKALVQRDRVT